MSSLPFNIAPGVAEAAQLNENFTYLESLINSAAPGANGIIDVQSLGATPDGGDVGEYIHEANELLKDTGGIIYLPPGKWVDNGTKEVLLNRGVRVRGAGRTTTYGEAQSGFRRVEGITHLILNGVGVRYTKTFQNYRGAPSDPLDPPLSTFFNCQGIGQGVEDMVISLGEDGDLDAAVIHSRPCFSTRGLSVATEKPWPFAGVIHDSTRCTLGNITSPVASTSTTITLPSGTGAALVNDNVYRNGLIRIIRGTGKGQERYCTSYIASTRVLTISQPWTVNPDTTSVIECHTPEWASPAEANYYGVEKRYPTDAVRGTDRGYYENSIFTGGKYWGFYYMGANPAPDLDTYGYLYKRSLTVALTTQPANGDTLTLADLTVTFKTNPTDDTDVLIGATVAESFTNMIKLVQLIDTQADSSYPIFIQADYTRSNTAGNTMIVLATDDLKVTYNVSVTGTALSISNTELVDTGVDPRPLCNPNNGNILQPDRRSSSGSSSTVFMNCNFTGANWNEGLRLAEDILPIPNAATQKWCGSVFVGGLASIKGSQIQNWVFYNCRFESNELANVVLGRISRAMFINCHWEGSSKYSKGGVPLKDSFTGTVGAGSTTTNIVLNKPSAVIGNGHEVDDTYIGWDLTIGGVTKYISDYNGITKVATTAAFGSAPASGTPYSMKRKYKANYGSIVCIPGQQYLMPQLLFANMKPDPEFFDYEAPGVYIVESNGTTYTSNNLTTSGKLYVGGTTDKFAEIRLQSASEEGDGAVKWSSERTSTEAQIRYQTVFKLLNILIGKTDTESAYEAFGLRETGDNTELYLKARNVLTDDCDIRLYGLNTSIANTDGAVTLQCGDAKNFAFKNGSTTSYIMSSTILRPNTTNVSTLGSSTVSWKDLYLQNTPIVTSDESTKTDIEPISDVVLDAWASVQPKAYRLVNAVFEKGQNARTHFGYIAQDIERAFAAHGLDPFKYGLLCKRTDDKGEESLAVRYDQCHVLTQACINRNL
jgi:Chaperone of endosialidase